MNHIRLLILAIGLCLPGVPAFSQSLLKSARGSVERHVYTLDAETARRFAQGKVSLLDSSFDLQEVARIPSYSQFKDDLPPGHYLVVEAKDNYVTGTYKHVANCHLLLESDRTGNYLRVIDQDGKFVTDALLELDGEALVLDLAQQAYRVPKLRGWRAGWLELEHNGLRQFFRLDKVNSYDHSGLRRVARKTYFRVVRWVVNPVIFSVTLPFDLFYRLPFKGVIRGWPAWAYYRYLRLARVFNGRIQHFSLFSQPSYRPGDTVRFKLYATGLDGAPLRKKVKVSVMDRKGEDRIVARLKPLRPGCYVGSFVLHDSLELALDRSVSVNFEQMSAIREMRLIAQGRFVYEDYELKQYTFNMRAEEPWHHSNRPAVLYLSAKDFNDLNVLDARVRLSLVRPSLRRWEGRQLFLPDTIWSWNGLLDPAGETRVEVPLDAMPKASHQYTVVAECLTSDNERKQASVELEYYHDMGKVEIVRRGPNLWASYLVKDQSLPVAGTLNIANEAPVHLRLPCLVPINPAWVKVWVEAEGSVGYWPPKQPDSKPTIVGIHRGDSLFVRVNNEAGLPFSWKLREGKKVLAEGTDTSLFIARSASPRRQFALDMHGTYLGSSFRDSENFVCSKHLLRLDWKSPETVLPGGKAEMSIAVHDNRGRPVRKADLSAYGVNARFEGKGAPSGISVASTRLKHRTKARQEISLSPRAYRGQDRLGLHRWGQRLGLDSLPWYDFLYPGSQLYRYAYPIEADNAEIAPFVVRNGEIQPVQVVYVDAQPVFFAWSEPASPYSFKLDPNIRHMIEIRLPEAVVRLDTFQAIRGQKLIVSMDLDHLPPGTKTWKVSNVPQDQEADIIRNRTIGYRGPSYGAPVLILGRQQVFKVQSNSSSLCGPITDYQLDVLQVDGYQHRGLGYEQGFEWEFGPNVVKMRTLSPNRYPKSLTYGFNGDVADRPWRYDSLVAQWRRSVRPLVQDPYSNYLRWSLGLGRLQIDLSGQSTLPAPIRALVLQSLGNGRLDLLRFNFHVVNQANPGNYRCHLLLNDGQYVPLDTIVVKANGVNYYRMDVKGKAVRPSFEDEVWSPTPPPLLPSSGDGKEGASNLDSDPRWNGGEWGRGPRIVVSGVVKDAQTGEPLVGAVVKCMSYFGSAVTDIDGHFDLLVPVETDSIGVRYLGFADHYRLWNGQRTLDFQMETEAILLNEVVISDRRLSVDYLQMAGSMTVISAQKVEMVAERNVDLMSVSTASGVSRVWAEANNVPVTTDIQLGKVPAFPAELLAQLEGTATLRKRFRDSGFWEPSLKSDREGVARFSPRFPDDITRWDGYAVAVDRRGRIGAAQTAIRAWKPLMGRLAMPRFLVEGDTCLAIGKVNNYTGEEQTLQRAFDVAGKLQAVSGPCGPVQLDTLELVAIPGMDSVKVSYMARRADGYADGEEIGVKVFPRGSEVAGGYFGILKGDTSLVIEGLRADRGPVQVHAQRKVLNLLLQQTEALGGYQHLCNEQLSSKIIALVSEERIFGYLKQPWDHREEVQKCVNLLEKRLGDTKELPCGWFPGMPAEVWVSKHVFEALSEAKLAGYEVRRKVADWAPGLLNQFQPPWNHDDLELLQMVHRIEPTLDLHRQVETLDTLKYWDMTAVLELMELKLGLGLPIDLDSLDHMSKRDAIGARSWSPKSPYSYGPLGWRYWQFLPTLTAYRVCRAAGLEPAYRADILQYILSQCSENGWGNTYVNAKVLEALAPDSMLLQLMQPANLRLVIDGKHVVLPADSVFTLPQMPGRMEVIQEGKGFTFFSAAQRYWEPDPQPKDSLFKIHTFFEDELDHNLTQLEGGQPVGLVAQVEVRAPMEYVMIEIPIPAGCSYGSKTPGYYHPYGAYAEYFRDRVCFYFRKLPIGTQRLEVNLLPRFGGNYVLNPTRAEPMYFPTLDGYNGLRRVSIE